MGELISDVIRKIRKATSSKWKDKTKLKKIEDALDELTDTCGWYCQSCGHKWIEEIHVENDLENDDPDAIPCPKCNSKRTQVD